jgi:hypothetical protein
MTKGKRKAIVRKQVRRAINRSDYIGHGKMNGSLCRYGYGAGVTRKHAFKADVDFHSVEYK